MKDAANPIVDRIAARATELKEAKLLGIHSRVDRLFSYLMIIQWVAGIIAACVISPRTWAGATSEVHIHVWLAIFFGGAITWVPVLLAWCKPGATITRHTIAVGQILTSALLIHLSGGRIETHFHVFGSLAFLACYRDWKVLVTAVLVTATDHAFRGFYWPESVYGVATESGFRFLEHAGWVMFESVFLAVTIRQGMHELDRITENQAQLESANEFVESEVRRQTAELCEVVEQAAQANRELAIANRTLSEKNDELDQFTYIASHDLQEPVRKLVSFSSLLEQDVDGDLNEDAKRDLEFIVDAAQRMKKLVQALLEVSRVGRAALRKDAVDLNVCVDDALNALEVRIKETNATIQCDELPTINGDRVMIAQLFQNLIGNALKFIQNDQPIVKVSARPDEANNWIISVKDNGIGMKPEYADRIFQPFQRLHARSEFEGTGIGLSICKKTVERHNGRIWVESEVGKGAEFLFTIPCLDKPSAIDTPNLVVPMVATTPNATASPETTI